MKTKSSELFLVSDLQIPLPPQKEPMAIFFFCEGKKIECIGASPLDPACFWIEDPSQNR